MLFHLCNFLQTNFVIKKVCLKLWKKYACHLYSFMHILKSALKVFCVLEKRDCLDFFNVNALLIIFRLQLQLWFPLGSEQCKVCWFVCDRMYAGYAHCWLTPFLTAAISGPAWRESSPAQGDRRKGHFMKCKLRSYNINKTALKEVLFPAYICTTLYFQAVVHILCK